MRSLFPKISFVLSVAVLAFLGGFALRSARLPPNDFLERSWKQTRALFQSPTFLKPRVHDRKGVRIVKPDRIQPGVTLITSMWHGPDGWKPLIRILDRSGRTLHQWRIDGAELFPDSLNLNRQRYLHGSHLLPNGDILFNVEHGGTVRVDACGRVRWRLPAGTHHSIERAEDGSFWISDVSPKPRTTSDRFPKGYPGLSDSVYVDQIAHVSATGRLLSVINVLDLLYANDLERYLSKAYIAAMPASPMAELPGPDPTHLNDVEPLPSSMADEYPLFEAGDLLVSLRNIHLVFVVDPETRSVKWHASDPFIMQHDPDFMGNGWIGVFDNNRDFTPRGRMLGGSRIVALQPHTDSTKVLFSSSRSAPFYTKAGGKWQHLPNGNLLLTENHASRVVEVTPEGQTIWEWVKAPYSDTQVPSVQEGTRYAFSPAEVESWDCSSKDVIQTPRP